MRKLNDKQKCAVSLALVILMAIVLFYTYEEKEAENQYTGIIRLHVIANSDTQEDQDLKLKVRDKILKEVGGNRKQLNMEDTRSYLQSNLKTMEHTAASVIKENGKSYPVTADLGVRWIPEKSYGDTYFPAGNYEALNITIGSGEGQNWWCVLFPPLCLIDEDADAMSKMGIDKEQQVQLKSKLVEILKNKNAESN